MLRLTVDKLKGRLQNCDDFQSVGRLRSAQGILSANLHARIGDLCQIPSETMEGGIAEVIGFRDQSAQLLPYVSCAQLASGAWVTALGRPLRVPVGNNLLGRVMDGIGNPIDGLGPLGQVRYAPVHQEAPSPMDRPRITECFATGQRVIDSLITMGQGQRLALLAGSGVGKSTLLGEIAKGSCADINVVALIGERGREVRPFLDDCLGPQGIRRSVTIVATAEQQPLMRVRAAQAAMTIADSFREQGLNVLFMLDSITRLAAAQREIGILVGEPPSSRGYTPSVFHVMSTLLERMGTSGQGSITSIISVLVDGDDMDEPITDAVRSVVDGHVVLDRTRAHHGHFPAIDISKSLSRVFRDVTTPQHQLAAKKLRDALATYEEVADLIRIGAYTKGTSARIDTAIVLKGEIDEFVKQRVGDYSPIDTTLQRMQKISQKWLF